MDEVSLAVDIRPHLRIPPAGAMPEMNAGLDQVLHLHNSHALPSCLLAGSRLLKTRPPISYFHILLLA
jgi:hypothetical protein